jgi:hypothetical protein
MKQPGRGAKAKGALDLAVLTKLVWENMKTRRSARCPCSCLLPPSRPAFSFLCRPFAVHLWSVSLGDCPTLFLLLADYRRLWAACAAPSSLMQPPCAAAAVFDHGRPGSRQTAPGAHMAALLPPLVCRPTPTLFWRPWLPTGKPRRFLPCSGPPPTRSVPALPLSALRSALATSVARHPLHLRTPRKQGWRRLCGRHLRTFAAAYAAGNCLASSQPPPSRLVAWAASWSSTADRGLPLSALALAFATLLAEAGPCQHHHAVAFRCGAASSK